MKLSDIAQAVIEGNSSLASRLVREALNQSLSPRAIFQEGLIPGMNEVGSKMSSGEYYIPEVLLSARAMKQAAAILKPFLSASGDEGQAGKIAIGTVRGDLHDIGKNLVIVMLEGAGFEVIDLGVDVSPDKIIATLKEVRVDIIGLSALLSVTMINMREVVHSLEAAGFRPGVKVMIGGAPVSRKFADEIGADGYAPDASSAVGLARSLMTAGGK